MFFTLNTYHIRFPELLSFHILNILNIAFLKRSISIVDQENYVRILNVVYYIPSQTGNENEMVPMESNNNLPECTNANAEPAVKLKASFDAGWQRRGTGHAYNSLSGTYDYVLR